MNDRAPGLVPETLGDWLTHMERVHSKHIEMGLERVSQVGSQMGLKPDFPLITVGGTNGKGSVCAMLQAVLTAAGYRTGCYSSPHLLRYNERVRIGRADADDATLCRSLAAVEAARQGVALTYFEFGTLAAMKSFVDAGVDAAILEVGLGGRLDAVNIFDSDCAVITSIGIDHVDYLGHTRESIGWEKAGIFRPQRPAVCGESDPPDTVEAEARRVGTRLLRFGADFGFAGDRLQWSYRGPGGKRGGLPLPALRGAHQLRNAAVVLAVLDEMKEKLPVAMRDLRQGLVDVALPGRFQVIPGRPAVVLDVAHNPQAAEALAASLGEMGPFRKTVAVFAMLRDKDIAGVVRAVRARIDAWFVGGIDGPRGASAAEVREVIEAQDGVGPVQAFRTPSEAFARACESAGADDRICVFGSFYTVADVMRDWQSGPGKNPG